MSNRSPLVPTGIKHRSAANHDLSFLLAEIRSAREADRVARGAPQRDNLRSDARRLAASLTAYAKALERYGLPVPRAIRDELRLRQKL